MKKFLLLLVGCMVAMSTVSFAEEGFPLRAKFPQVKYMSTETLHKDYQKVIIVDVRSKIEFDVIHINKAVHEPMATALFAKSIEKLRDKNGSAPMAFYCNGHSCAKSYEAAEIAIKAGFTNVFAYDAGIQDWVKAHPDKTTLMGKTPAPADKLISKEKFEKKSIGFNEFKTKAAAADAIIVDAREPFQRKEIPQLPGTLRNIPSDRLVELIKTGEFKGNTLLILDAVGKQVEWIQYYLEAGGYSNYYFLKKGVLSAVEAGAVK